MMDTFAVFGLVLGAFIVGVVVCSMFSTDRIENRRLSAKLHNAVILSRSAMQSLRAENMNDVKWFLDSIAALEGED